MLVEKTHDNEYFRATNGDLFPVDSPKSYTYDGNENLQYITVTVGAKTYRKTLTYTSSLLTSDSGWVLQ